MIDKVDIAKQPCELSCRGRVMDMLGLRIDKADNRDRGSCRERGMNL